MLNIQQDMQFRNNKIKSFKNGFLKEKFLKEMFTYHITLAEYEQKKTTC